MNPFLRKALLIIITDYLKMRAHYTGQPGRAKEWVDARLIEDAEIFLPAIEYLESNGE